MLDKTSKYALICIYSIYALVKEQGQAMPETHEQIAARSRQLIPIVDDMFEVFEQVHRLLCQWQPSYRLSFIAYLVKLQQLESELVALGFDDDFVLIVKQIIYHSVFGDWGTCADHENFVDA